MPEPVVSPVGVGKEMLIWANPEAGEEADAGGSTDGACLPALARRFPITDPQQWLDLCA